MDSTSKWLNHIFLNSRFSHERFLDNVRAGLPCLLIRVSTKQLYLSSPRDAFTFRYCADAERRYALATSLWGEDNPQDAFHEYLVSHKIVVVHNCIKAPEPLKEHQLVLFVGKVAASMPSCANREGGT